jgi:hypothetical protein
MATGIDEGCGGARSPVHDEDHVVPLLHPFESEQAKGAAHVAVIRIPPNIYDVGRRVEAKRIQCQERRAQSSETESVI